jgi:gluconolactonase
VRSNSVSSRSVGAVKAILLCGAALVVVGACSPEKASGSDPASAAADAVSEPTIVRLDPALDAVIAPEAKLEIVAEGLGFVEGPVWTHGELWFSDLTGNRLHAVGADGGLRTLIENSGGVGDAPHSQYPGTNGAAVDRDGTVLITQHAARRIIRVARDLTVTPVLERDGEGRRFNSPNDLMFAPDGALWFTDPPFGLAQGDADPLKEIPYNGVYRWKDGKVTAVITDLPNPNGIGFSPDGRRLYISNSGPAMFVNVYDVAADGSVSNGRLLIAYDSAAGGHGVPDGLKVDAAGNIWTSGPGGIRIISPEGKVLGQIRTNDEAQANLVWGGADQRTAYITAATRVYRLELPAPGVKPLFVN